MCARGDVETLTVCITEAHVRRTDLFPRFAPTVGPSHRTVGPSHRTAGPSHWTVAPRTLAPSDRNYFSIA
jgi:hypothetical protein